MNSNSDINSDLTSKVTPQLNPQFLYDPMAHYRLWDVVGTNSSVLHRCWAEIDLAALQANVHMIRARIPSDLRYIAVVKADAYGHGLYAICSTLMKAGVDCLAVATVYEAAEIRQLSKGFPILVLGGVLPEEEACLVDYELIAVVSTVEEVERFNRLAKRAKKPISIHFKIDTGMGRSGVWYEEAEGVWEAIRRSKHLNLHGVMTHFACAENDPERTVWQRANFQETLKKLSGFDPQGLWIHADNSAGLQTLPPESFYNAVRVGLLQYGVSPLGEERVCDIPVQPILSLHARLSIIKNLPKGASISYGATYTLSKDSRVGIVTAGYADGIPLAMSNQGYVVVRNKRCPILGRVAMDQMVVDLSDASEAIMGDEVILIGGQVRGKSQTGISVYEFSQWGHTMPWETLCSLSKRVKRVYRTSSMN